MKYYEVGDEPELRGDFSDDDSGEPVSPADVRCVLLKPDGSAEELEPTNPDTGVYLASHYITEYFSSPASSERYHYLFVSLDDFRRSVYGKFGVRNPRIPLPS